MLRKLLGALATLLLLAPAAYASPAKVVIITAGTSWTVPSDFSASNTVELIGGGAQGGGAYAKKNNVVLTWGASVTYQIGAGVNGVSTAGDTCFISCATAKAAGANGATAGLAANSVGDVKTSGGAGSGNTSGFSGGGAAGPHGAGVAGTPGGGQPGGAGDAGFGGAGGNGTNQAGGNGAEWGSAGSGGGASGSGSCAAATCKGGLYGGGTIVGANNALGGNGVIVITYVPRGRVSSGAF